MPNGSGLTAEQYQTLDAFVAPMDVTIQRFAQDIGAKLDIGYHEVPDRRVCSRRRDGMEQLVEIAPRFLGDNGLSPICLVSSFVWKDYPPLPNDPVNKTWMKRPHRKLWHQEIARLAKVPTSPQDILKILEAAFAALQAVSEDDLSYRG